MNALTPALRLAALLSLACCSAPALAQEAVIRKNLAERLPNFPKIDEVSKTPIPGLYEMRIGTDVLYTDEQGNHLIQGQIIDTRTRTNLTEARIEKLTAIDFAKLPLKDAMVIKQGSGARKLAVFVDPNCGYCKRFERDLLNVKDVTIYTFLYPILGPDSQRQVARHLVRQGRGQGLARLDGRRRDAAQGHAASATAARSSATSRSARSTASTARRRWSSRTACASRARCRRPQVEKLLAAATPK